VSFSETVFLFVLALVVFGPKKLPEIARQLGKLMAEFRRASNEFKSQIEQEIAHLEVEDRRKSMLAAVPPPEGTASRKPITTRGELTTFEAPATLAAALEPLASDSESPKPAVGAMEAVPSAETDAALSTSAGSVPENGVGSVSETAAAPAATSSESHESSSQREQQESHA
jgi:sec-independent protein translocase protein TatB